MPCENASHSPDIQLQPYLSMKHLDMGSDTPRDIGPETPEGMNSKTPEVSETPRDIVSETLTMKTSVL